MTDIAATLRQRQGRWLMIGLVVSLALNAFFLGALATDLLRLSGADNAKPVHFELRWLEGRLPPDQIAKVAAAVDAQRPNTEGHIARLRALRVELGALAAAAEPDRAALDGKLAEIRAELDRMVGDIQATAIDALLALPPDTRAGLADGVTK